MIAKLRGRLDSVGDDWAVIDAGGVGYLVYCSARTLRALPEIEEAATLWIETHVREDHIHLYGFTAPKDREWFRLLQTVQGVGARMALNVLSLLDTDQLGTAIAAQDKAALTQVSGVGPKLAARMLAELKDKAPAMATKLLRAETAHGHAGAPAQTDKPGTGVPDDAVSALVNLGYGRAEAYGAVATAARTLTGENSLQALIRAGLKELSQ